MKGEAGQMTLEAILIIAVLLGGAMSVAKMAKSQHWMETLVSGPWKPVKAMIEDGTWNANNSKAYNPAMMSRHGTYRGDEVQGQGEAADPGQ